VYRDGHLGAALLAYVPVGMALTAIDAAGLAVLGAGLSVSLSMVPDYDQRVPFVAHRGVTHTLAFGAALGAALGVAAATVGATAGLSVDPAFAVYGLHLAAL
jgi:inner membrane protein